MKKKNEEKYYLNLFKEYYPKFPEGEIIEYESPDFLVKNGNETIGIELSRIFQKDNSSRISPQAKDSIQDDIISRIRNQMVKSNLNHYEVHIAITINNNLIKKDRITIVNKIFEIIKNNLPGPLNYIRMENDFNDINSFPYQVSSIAIINLPGLDVSLVSDSKFGWVQKDMINDLVDIISKKNDKLSLYKENCHEYWLIIYTTSNGSGNIFDPSEETFNCTYYSKFDKIFFFNILFRKIYLLNICQSVT